MTIPVDIYLTQDRTFEIGGDGDLKVAEGQDGVNQEIVVKLLNRTTPELGQGITQLFVEEFEADVERALRKSEYAEPPFDVNIVDVENSTVFVNISTADDEMVIEVDE